MHTITVVCYEEGYQQNVLIYAVDVKNPDSESEVQAAVQVKRAEDIDEPNDMVVLFAFDGDLDPVADWRD